jgi:hypothetical protein
LGYSTSPNAVVPYNFTEANIVNNNYIYYAVFSGESSVKDSINVNYSNFKFVSANYEDGIDGSFDVDSGYSVSPANYKQLTGKITIPAMYNNKPVIKMSGFSGQRGITGIFFEEGSIIRMVDSSACADLNTLKYFEIPSSLRVISNTAFYNCESLKLIPQGSSKSSTEYVLGGANLYRIGKDAFNNGISSDCTALYVSHVVEMG